MNPINEVIAALVARGFVLPPSVSILRFNDGNVLVACRAVDIGAEDWRRQEALDLVACEFARQTHLDAFGGMRGDQYLNFCDTLSDGDTEAALRVLWEATV